MISRRKKTKKQRTDGRQLRQCIVLGLTAFLLFLALTIQAIQKNRTQEAGFYNYIKGLEKNEKESTGQGTTETDGVRFFSTTGAQEASDDLLILVNKSNKIPDDFVAELHWLQNRSCAVSELMYDALAQMLTDGSEEGRQFVVASGYRSRERQQQLLDEDIARDMQQEGMSYQEAYEKETRETMPPGYSEHETGLAVDIVALDYQILDGQQELTEENIWLQENCSRYGFILRYPQGSEEITGVNYESWHFRYVGKEAAQEIMDKGITLEEYVQLSR